MADYAFFTMFMWLVKGVLILLSIAGLVLLVWWIRVSFRSRRARRALVVFCCVVLACAVAVIVMVQRYQSPSRIVQRMGAIPLPKGITMVDAHQSTGLDSSEIWLHFTMSPKDFDTILSSETYTKLPYRNLNFDAYSPPKWWDINRLGQCSFYQCASGSAMGYDKSGKDIVVNAERTEAFFLMRCWYDN